MNTRGRLLKQEEVLGGYDSRYASGRPARAPTAPQFVSMVYRKDSASRVRNRYVDGIRRLRFPSDVHFSSTRFVAA
jgi:hypothetical protein